MESAVWPSPRVSVMKMRSDATVVERLIAITTNPSAAAMAVTISREPRRSIRLPTPNAKSAPASVATRLICAVLDAIDGQVGKERLGDEAEALRAPWERADHRERGDADNHPAVVVAAGGGHQATACIGNSGRAVDHRRAIQATNTVRTAAPPMVRIHPSAKITAPLRNMNHTNPCTKRDSHTGRAA